MWKTGTLPQKTGMMTVSRTGTDPQVYDQTSNHFVLLAINKGDIWLIKDKQ
jgi:hypothetical protein